MTGYVIRVQNTKVDSILYLNSWAFEGDTKFVDFTYNINEALMIPSKDLYNFFEGLIRVVKGDKFKCEIVRVQRITVIVEPNLNLA